MCNLMDFLLADQEHLFATACTCTSYKGKWEENFDTPALCILYVTYLWEYMCKKVEQEMYCVYCTCICRSFLVI